MYSVSERYEEICAFIAGVDYGRESVPLNGFNKWLRARFKVESARAWEWYISDIYDNLSRPYLTKTEFMLDLIEQFLNDPARKPPVA